MSLNFYNFLNLSGFKLPGPSFTSTNKDINLMQSVSPQPPLFSLILSQRWVLFASIRHHSVSCDSWFLCLSPPSANRLPSLPLKYLHMCAPSPHLPLSAPSPTNAYNFFFSIFGPERFDQNECCLFLFQFLILKSKASLSLFASLRFSKTWSILFTLLWRTRLRSLNFLRSVPVWIFHVFWTLTRDSLPSQLLTQNFLSLLPPPHYICPSPSSIFCSFAQSAKALALATVEWDRSSRILSHSVCCPAHTNPSKSYRVRNSLRLHIRLSIHPLNPFSTSLEYIISPFAHVAISSLILHVFFFPLCGELHLLIIIRISLSDWFPWFRSFLYPSTRVSYQRITALADRTFFDFISFTLNFRFPSSLIFSSCSCLCWVVFSCTYLLTRSIPIPHKDHGLILYISRSSKFPHEFPNRPNLVDAFWTFWRGRLELLVHT